MSSSTSSATSGRDSDETLFSSASASTSSSMTSAMMRYTKQDDYIDPYNVGKLSPRTRTNALFQYVDTIMVMLQSAWNTRSGYKLLPEDKAIAMLHPSVNLFETDDIPQHTLNVKKGLIDRDRVKMQHTAMFVSALVICVGSLQMEFTTCPLSPPHGQKRKHLESPPEKTPENPLARPEHPSKLPKPNEDNSTPRCMIGLQDPHKTQNIVKPLGDIFYKFDPDKYRETCHDIGAKDTNTLFRKDGKHLRNVHVNQQHSLTDRGLWDLHFYDPRHDINLAAEAPTPKGELEVFIWKCKFVRKFPSFAPLRDRLNPYKGESLLPEELDEEMARCQLMEYRRCRRTPDCGKGEPCRKNLLCHVLGDNSTPYAPILPRPPNANGSGLKVVASIFIGLIIGGLLAQPEIPVVSAPSHELHPAVNDEQPPLLDLQDEEQQPYRFFEESLDFSSVFPSPPVEPSQFLQPHPLEWPYPGIQDEHQRRLHVPDDEPSDSPEMFPSQHNDRSQSSSPLNPDLTSETIQHLGPYRPEDRPGTTSRGSGSTAKTRQSDAQTLCNDTEVDVAIHNEDGANGGLMLGVDLDLGNEQGQKEINRYYASEAFMGQPWSS